MDTTYTTTIDGNNVTFEFKDCLIHTEGDHAGNIDAIITTTPPLPQNLLLDELHIKVPGTDEYLYIYGYGVVESSLKATFNSSTRVDKDNLPDKVGVYWGPNGEQFIGDMNCKPYSEKIEHDLTDEILPEAVPETTETQGSKQEAASEVEQESDKKEVMEQGKSKSLLTANHIIIGIALLIVILGGLLLL